MWKQSNIYYLVDCGCYLVLERRDTVIHVPFCVVSGSPRYYMKWNQRNDISLFVLLGENGGRLDSKRQWEENMSVARWLSLSPRVLLTGLSIWVWEAYWRFRILEAICLIRGDFYLYPKRKGNPSLSEYHPLQTLWPIADHSVHGFRIL